MVQFFQVTGPVTSAGSVCDGHQPLVMWLTASLEYAADSDYAPIGFEALCEVTEKEFGGIPQSLH
jgi:hypothetical protein